MTRREAKNIVEEVANKNKTIVWLLDTDIFKIIDMIYDDFEDKCENCKICRNCKHNLQCDIQKALSDVIGDRVYDDFGCNRFERR